MKHYECKDAMSRDDLRKACIENGWFCSGSSAQYEKLFDALELGADTKDLALIIWTCSDGFSLEDIREELDKLSTWPIWIRSLEQTLIDAEWGETEREIILEAIRSHPDAGASYIVKEA